MTGNQRRRLPWVLMLLGALMALYALGMLLQTGNMLQYCALAPEAGEKGENLKALADSARRLGDSMKDTFAWTAIGGTCGTVTLSSESSSAEAKLIAMGEGWLEIYPRFLVRGRRIGESELQQGAAVIMLDEDLAFSLFGTELPEDAAVILNNVTFQVVGTVRHGGSRSGRRGVGDTVAFDAYVPLLTVVANEVPLKMLMLSVLPQDNSGTAQIFRENAMQWLAGGEMIDLQKEAMRRTVLPRILLLIVGLYAMVGLFRRMACLASKWFDSYMQSLKGSYFTALIPRLLGTVAMTLLGFGALIGATYLLMLFSVQPLYVFTEWVPENIVEWTSIARVFWNLTAEAARPVRIGSRELRVVEFWGGLLRWGVIMLLLGAALLPKARRPQKR